MYKLLVYILKKYIYKIWNNIILSFTNVSKFITFIVLKFSINFKKFNNKLQVFVINIENLSEFIFCNAKAIYVRVHFYIKKNQHYKKLKFIFIFIKILKLFLLNLVFYYNYLHVIIKFLLFNYIIFVLFFSVFLKQICLFFFKILYFFYFFFLNFMYQVGYFFKIFFILTEIAISRLYSFFELHLIQFYDKLLELLIIYIPILLENFYVTIKKFKSFLYNRVYYDFFLGAFLFWSQTSYGHTGRSFTSREDIIQNYSFILPAIKRFYLIYLVNEYYELKYFLIEFYYFYKSFTINFFFWIIKNYIFTFLANVFIFAKKNYVFNFFFLIFILVLLKLIKFVFLVIFLNFFKFKLFKIPFYVIFNFYRNPLKRSSIFFKNLSQRIYRHTVLSWLFIPSRLFFRKKRFFEKKLKFKLSYMIFRKSWKELHEMHSLFDVWAHKHFLNNSFVFAIKKIRYRWRKRYYLYKKSVGFRHKFGLGRFGIIKTIIRDVFYFLLASTFKYAYVMAHIFAYIINKIIYIIKKIIESSNK